MIYHLFMAWLKLLGSSSYTFPEDEHKVQFLGPCIHSTTVINISSRQSLGQRILWYEHGCDIKPLYYFQENNYLALSLSFTSSSCQARIYSSHSLFSTLKRHLKYLFLIFPVYLTYVLLHIQKVSFAHSNIVI